MDYWRENAEFFRKWDPHLLRELEAEGAEAVIEETVEGFPTLRIEDHFFHHPERPKEEARNHIGQSREGLRLHFGFGLGYFLDAEQPIAGSRILIYEPNQAFVKQAMSLRRFALVFRQKRATLCCNFRRFQYLAIKWQAGSQAFGFFASPKHAAWDQGAFHQFQRLLTSLSSPKPARKSSRLFPLILESSRSSLPWHIESTGFEVMRGRLKNRPAVIVAAGPSLNKNLSELQPYKTKTFIFAIARTAKALAAHDISPHFLAHVEAQDYFHLIEGCPNLEKTAFLLAAQAHPRFYTYPCKKRYVFQSRTNPLINSLVERYPFMRREPIKTGGSVATAAFYLAVLAGCNPIILIGQDLATKGKIWYEKTNLQPEIKTRHRNVVGYFGGEAQTWGNYHNNIIWYSQALPILKQQYPKTQFINATEGGAHLPGFENMKFKDAAHVYLKDEVHEFCPEGKSQSMTSRQLKSFLDDMDQFKLNLESCVHEFEEAEPKIIEAISRSGDLPKPDRLLTPFLACMETSSHFSHFLKAELAWAKLIERQLGAMDDMENLAQIAALHAELANVLRSWR